VRAMLEVTSGTLGNMDARSWDGSDLAGCLSAGTLLLAKAMIPIVGGLVAAGFLGCVVQTGFLFSGAPVAVRFGRLNPLAGLRGLVSGEGLVRIAGSVVKLGAIALVAYVTLRAQIASSSELTGGGAGEIAAFAMNCAFVLLFRVGVALLAVCIVEYAYQRWRFLREMRMTREEVREELKRMEGDPLTRSRRRRMQQMIAMERMMRSLGRADVVVMSPGDVSAALRYEGGEVHAPTLVAKCRGEASRRMLAVAEEHGVPVVEDVALAQALHRRCNVGEQIPRDLYGPAAGVLAYVFEVKRGNARPAPSVA